ncbi:unnamed protein product [Prorocentrum cordatum]|uniref:Uncharacterized protein n=1 Tax=Prorocentrum cordatum TaxID=2364126 RepID=A0ABN9UT94_9DINO|nr:unnamed protein product [Polarella glacialis]
MFRPDKFKRASLRIYHANICEPSPETLCANSVDCPYNAHYTVRGGGCERSSMRAPVRSQSPAVPRRPSLPREGGRRGIRRGLFRKTREGGEEDERVQEEEEEDEEKGASKRWHARSLGCVRAAHGKPSI